MSSPALRGNTDVTNIQPSPTRLNVKYVVAVWGERYIERFFEFSFPTHLSAENLPALAKLHDLSFTVLTRSADVATFKQHPRFSRLAAFGPVAFVEIDDLISHAGVFTVTLTLAFTRAMRKEGPRATDCAFIFMNADFVLADGTLKTVAERLGAGASAVLAASPRTVAEDLEARIRALSRTADGAIALPPREAVAMALSAPHPMVTAKQPRLEMFHSAVPNQLFWFHDENTLLARSFLMFMLALRPKQSDYRATSYCDYTFIHDLADPDRISIITDSDDGFLLELQARHQEIETIRFGPLGASRVTDHLAEWTNEHHRRIATYDLVFHSDELPTSLSRTREEAKAFVETVLAALPPPVPAHRHPYWIDGVAAWKFHRPDAALPEEVLPPRPAEPSRREVVEPIAEIASDPLPVVRDFYGLVAKLRGFLLETPAVGDLSGALQQWADPGRTRQFALVGASLPGWRLEPVAQLAELQSNSSVLPPAIAKAVDKHGRLLISLSDEQIGDVPVALALAARVARTGVPAAIVLARHSLSPQAFNEKVLEVFLQCRPADLHMARAIVNEDQHFSLTLNRFRRSVARYRREPRFRNLLPAIRKGLPLTRLQFEARYPLLRPRKGGTIPGVALLIGEQYSGWSNHD